MAESPFTEFINFLVSLPDTIREGIATSIAIGFMSVTEMDDKEPTKDIILFLDVDEAYLRSTRLPMLCGAMDVALVHDDLEPFFKQVASETGMASAHKFAAQEPLRVKHYDQAAAEFQRLRSGVLSPRSLRQWGLSQLR